MKLAEISRSIRLRGSCISSKPHRQGLHIPSRVVLTPSSEMTPLFGTPSPDNSPTKAGNVPVPLTPYALAIGDVDGNGTADLVSIANGGAASSTTVGILLSDGHGTFQQSSARQIFAGTSPGSACLADLDGDGKADLVLSIKQASGTLWSIVWLKNTGGGFAAPVTLASTSGSGFSVADFNGDGKPDILYTAPATSN